MDLVGRLTAALSDRYAVERELGSGGMATVYLAADLKHHRPVAIKVLDPEVAATVGAERFLREIETAANLTHPHILPLHDSGEADGFVYYVMPYVEGESLRARLDREGQLPVDDAVRVAREIADALAYAHERGVIHRDVKPANILLEAGHAVLADFGVAQAVVGADETRLTATGVSLGTPSYMSPEQAAGERDLDGRSDQYALGCVLYEMLAGEAPFTGKRAESVVRQHLVSEARPIKEVRSTVPAEVETALAKALAKAPADRWGTTGELAKVLDGQLYTPAGGTPSIVPGHRRWLGRAAGAVVGAALVVALLVLGPWSGEEPPAAPAGPIPWTVLAEVEGSAPSELRDLMRTLLVNDLNASEVLRVLPADQVRLGFETMLLADSASLTPDVAKDLAERAEIQTVIVPTMEQVGGSFALALQALRVSDDVVLGTAQAQADDEDALLTASSDVIGSMVSQVRDEIGRDRAREVTTLPMTSSLEAYRKHREAGRLYNEGYYPQALSVADEALRIDPDFALAWALKATVYSALSIRDSAEAANREALRRPDRLSEQARLDLEANPTGDPVTALQLHRRRYLETGTADNSLGVAYIQAGLWEEAVGVYEEMERQAPFGLGGRGLYNWAFALGVLGRTDEARPLLPRLTGSERVVRTQLAQRQGDWDQLQDVAERVLADPTMDPGFALRGLASAHAARGRIAEAFRVLEEELRVTLEQDLRYDRQAIARFVLTVASGHPAEDYPLGDLPPDATEWDRVWEGLWAVELGDTALANQYLGTLQEPELPEFDRPRALAALTVVLRAGLAARNGDWTEAHRFLESVTGDRAPIVNTFWEEQPRNQLGHWSLAEAQEQVGELEAAAASFVGVAAGDQFGWSDLYRRGLTYSFAHRRAALLYGRLGDSEKAIEHWTAFLDAFTDPDPDFEWMVEEARTELARLEA